jgi:post-segregation antitoxin (ccd killing protein)
MDWTVWIVGGLVAIVAIGAAWWTSEQRRIDAWREQNREHAAALDQLDDAEDSRNTSGGP